MYEDVRVLNRFSKRILKGNLNVGLGEIGVGESDINLRVPALGSCVALVIYVQDQPKDARIGLMAHIVYPSSDHPMNPGTDIISRGKYADIAISRMIEFLRRKGFSKTDLAAKMTGGLTHPNSDLINLKTNPPVIIKLLKQEKIPLKSSYTGGIDTLEAIFKVKEYKLYVTPRGAPTIIL